MSDQKTYSYEQVAKLTSKSVRTVKQLVYDGVLPAKKDGRRVLILAPGVDKYIESLPDMSSDDFVSRP